MNGTIIITSDELSRYSVFAYSMMMVQTPPGTIVKWTCGADICWNLNEGIRQMQGDWIWVMGDDHQFQPDILMKLLEHDVDVVVPMVLKRAQPYTPVVYAGEEDGVFRGMDFNEIDPADGLVEIFAGGCPGMLVRKSVLDDLGDPWFLTSGVGKLDEDLEFCRKIREAGYKMWLDPSLAIGHCTTMVVWPDYSPETKEWKAKFKSNSNLKGFDGREQRDGAARQGVLR